MSKVHPEAVEHLRSIESKQKQLSKLMGEIRHRQGKLRRIVVDAFNKESEPIDGMTIDMRQVVFGTHECDESPIGVCVYGVDAIPLPGQREMQKQHVNGTYDVINNYPETARTDACLFCGHTTTPSTNPRW